MTISDSHNAVSLTVSKFPQNILIPNIDNAVSLQVVNNLNKEADFKFEFKGENIEIKVSPEEFNTNIKLKAGEQRKINLNLIPKADGFGKLIINIYWLKLIEYTEKVQKLRTTISSSKIEKILAKTQILSSKTVDNFNRNDFIIEVSKSDVKKIEKDLASLINTYQVQQKGNNNQNGKVSSDVKVNIREIDVQYKKLAKGYLAVGEMYKALESALRLSKQEEQTQFYYDLIRVNSVKNLDASLQIIKNLNDETKRNVVLSEIAYDYVDINPNEISKIISLISKPSSRDQAITDIISKSYKSQFDIALKYSYLISEEFLKVKVLFNLMKELQTSKKNEQILQVVKYIDQIIKNSSQINLSENEFKNPAYSYLKNAICIIAELDCPETADNAIKEITAPDIREKLAKDLFDLIYEMVNEVKTRVETTTIFSQFYSLNTYISNLSNELQQFALLGGNASSNALMNDFDFKILFISLFSLNFSIFPFLDRVYTDLKYTSKKSIAYYIYPSINNLDQEELSVIQRTLKQFFPSSKLNQNLIIFNLDFIPYLGKPTIIFASNSSSLSMITSKVESKIGSKATILIDDGVFKGGASLEPIQNTLGVMGADIVNLVLSYEFLNDYDLFKMFIESLL